MFDRQAALQAGYTEKEIDEYLASKQPSQGGGFSKYIEPALSVVSGMIAEPISGLAGLAQLPFGGADKATQTIQDVRSALTYSPRTQAGQTGLQQFGEMMSPLTAPIQRAQEVGGQKGYELAGPVGGAIMETLPTATLMMLGARGAKPKTKAPAPRQVNKLLKQAAPDITELKTAARGIYNELDDAGAVVSSGRISGLGNEIGRIVKKEGIDPDLHPKSTKVLSRFVDAADSNLSLTEVDTLRKIAKDAASSIDPSDARIGAIIVDKVDDFLDNLQPKDFIKGKVADAGPKYREARQLWQRAKKSELLNDAFEKAKNQASGFENGIRTQFRSLLNNKKKMRGFTPEEISAMQYVVRGGTAENMAKRLGKLGFGEGQATSMLLGSLGVAGGAAIGGAPGAVAIPLIGTVSRNLAQKLTRNNARMADLITRAGPKGPEVVRAYLQSVKPNERNVAELTELLIRPEVSLKGLNAMIPKSGPQRKLVADAVFFADFMRQQEEQ